MLDSYPDLTPVEQQLLDDFWRLRVAAPADTPIAIESLIAYWALSSEERRLIQLMNTLDSSFLKFQANMNPERRKKLRERDGSGAARLKLVPRLERIVTTIRERREAKAKLEAEEQARLGKLDKSDSSRQER
jgi:hypothetical protein